LKIALSLSFISSPNTNPFPFSLFSFFFFSFFLPLSPQRSTPSPFSFSFLFLSILFTLTSHTHSPLSAGPLSPHLFSSLPFSPQAANTIPSVSHFTSLLLYMYPHTRIRERLEPCPWESELVKTRAPRVRNAEIQGEILFSVSLISVCSFFDFRMNRLGPLWFGKLWVSSLGSFVASVEGYFKGILDDFMLIEFGFSVDWTNLLRTLVANFEWVIG
jgi:hypothetical protein